MKTSRAIASTAELQETSGSTAKGLTLIYAQVLPVMAIVSLFPAIPKFFEHFGAMKNAALLVPMIVTIPSLVLAITAPFAGMLADRFGRRLTLLAGMVLYPFAGLAPLVIDQLGLIVASRALLGVAEAFIVTVSSALIGDYFGEDRHKWVAWVGVIISIVGVLLVAAGGALADFSWRGPFMVYFLAIPGMIMALLFIDEPLKLQENADQVKPYAPYPWREAILIGSVTLLVSIIYYIEPLNIATILHDRGAGSSTRIGLIQASTAIFYICGAFLYRKLHLWPIGSLLALAGVLIGAGQIVIGLAPTYQVVALGAVIHQLGAGIVIPALLSWGQAILPIEQRGRGMGIWATAFFTGTFLCPPMVSLVNIPFDSLRTTIAALGVFALFLALMAQVLANRSARSMQGNG